MHWAAVKTKAVASMFIVPLAACRNGHMRWRRVSVGLCQCKELSLCSPPQRALQVSMSPPSLRCETNIVCASALHRTLGTVGRDRWHPARDVLLQLLPLGSCPEVLCPD